jgi:hypothetical protein
VGLIAGILDAKEHPVHTIKSLSMQVEATFHRFNKLINFSYFGHLEADFTVSILILSSIRCIVPPPPTIMTFSSTFDLISMGH